MQGRTHSRALPDGMRRHDANEEHDFVGVCTPEVLKLHILVLLQPVLHSSPDVHLLLDFVARFSCGIKASTESHSCFELLMPEAVISNCSVHCHTPKCCILIASVSVIHFLAVLGHAPSLMNM